jgi:isopenicillin N synthase-like dioxygenase
MAALPILDIQAFRRSPDSPGGRRFVAELGAACQGPGFSYIVGHGIPDALESEAMAVAGQFFALPVENRLAIVNTNTPHFRGYTRLGMEHTNGKSDWREQIDIGPEREAQAAEPGAPPWLRLRGPNQWPEAVPRMRPVISRWMDQMAGLGSSILRALALGIGQAADHFDYAVSPDPEVLVKVIRYPAQTDPGDTGQGVGLHQDSGLVSFILQDDTGGLQVESQDGHGGELVDAAPMPGSYVLNLGEMLQVATHGVLRATRHRVVSPPPGRARTSLAYFFNPRMEACLQPVVLPEELATRAAGGQNANPADPIFATYGENWLKFRLRSHPDVARKHHADLLAAYRALAD